MKKYFFCLISLLVLTFILTSLNFIALKYDLFWVLKWFDIPMHFLGGLVVSFLASCIIYFKKINLSYIKFLSYNILTIFIISILWELFELSIKVTSLNDALYVSDTGLDFMANIFGGVCGSIFIFNKKADE